MGGPADISQFHDDPVCNGAVKFVGAIMLQAEALTIRIGPEKEYFAVGTCSGQIQIFPLPRKDTSCAPFEIVSEDESLPCTDIAFIPRQSEKKRLLAAFASGYIRLWQISPETSTYNLVKSWRENEHQDMFAHEEDEIKYNQILSIAASYDGKRFVTGGGDSSVRSYDIQTSVVGKILLPSIRTDATATKPFHTNRVTAVLYHTRGMRDQSFLHIFISASWDGTIQCWDDRTHGSVWQIAGTNVAGADGLCVDPIRNVILTGSYRHDKILAQVWEAKSVIASEHGRVVPQSVKPISLVSQEVGAPSMQVYVARVTADSQHMIFGGTNANLLKIINSTSLRTVGLVSNLSSGIYSADTCSDVDDRKKNYIVFTNGNKVYMLLMDIRSHAHADPLALTG